MRKLTDKKKKIIPIALFAMYVFVLCLTWLMTIDYNHAPDEVMKYDVCEYLTSNGKLPHGGEESIRNPVWGISYAFTPIFSYMISALFMKIASFLTIKFIYILWAARFVSVLSMTGYAIMCYKIASKLFKGIYKWLFTVLVTLLPQIVFLGSYLNNDSLALFSVSIIVYAWLLGLEKDWNWKSCIIMAIGIGVCALSYYNAYGYILCSVLIYFISNYRKKTKLKEFLKKGIGIALIAFVIAGWWFIRNFIIYDGDFLGMKTSNEYSEKYAIEEYKPSNRPTPANNNFSLRYMLFDMKWIGRTNQSFIGKFRYMDVSLTLQMYISYNAIFAIGLMGGGIVVLIQKIKNRNNKDLSKENRKHEKILWNMIMIICLIIPIGLSLYYSYFSDFQPQGRYIMSAIIPFMYYIVTGYKNIFEFMIKNEKIKNRILSILILVWAVMPIYIYFAYIRIYL